MRAGSVPPSSRRKMRMVSTCVLPVPALALTQAEAAGSAAWHWRRCVSCRARSSLALVGRKSRLLVGLERPFGDAGEMSKVVEAVGKARSAQRRIGGGREVEGGDQARKPGPGLGRQAAEVGVLG